MPELICPICHASGKTPVLARRELWTEHGGRAIEGVLRCSDSSCETEYPVIDGIAVVRADLRDWLIRHRATLFERVDLDPGLDTWLDDALEPNGWAEYARRLISTYAWDHFGGVELGLERGLAFGMVRRLLERAGVSVSGEVLDLGCATGGVSLGLAGLGAGRVVGVDQDAALIRVAARGLLEGRVTYALRRIGVVYDRVTAEIEQDAETRARVGLLAGDLLGLPFSGESADLVVMANSVDCVRSPVSALHEAWRVLKPGGHLLVCAPFDWAQHATPIEQWLGGHSPRGAAGGRPEATLRQFLTPGAHASSLARCEVIHEDTDLPWVVRIHDRSCVRYSVFGVVARKLA